MRKHTNLFLAALIGVFAFMPISVLAQQSEGNFYEQYKREREREQINAQVSEAFKRLDQLSRHQFDSNFSYDPYMLPDRSSRYFGSPDYWSNASAGSIKIPKPDAEIISRLEIGEDEIANHKTFLSASRTGIFKLLPLIDCSNLDKKENCHERNVQIRLFANAFSFRGKRNTMPLTADLIKTDDVFNTSQNANQSIFVNLGDVKLEDLSVNSAGMDFLVNFKPEKKAKKINEQYEQIAKGIKIGNYEYLKSLPISENATYALRSIAYQGSLDFPPGEIADVIVAFRVAGIDDDGTVTIIWKELSRKNGLRVRG